MKICYITSMFPCWSETFILNEISAHHDATIEMSIYSLKYCDETLVHAKAKQFTNDTVYPFSLFSVKNILAHLQLFCTNPNTYFRVFSTLLLIKSEDIHVKIKALAVFALSPKFILHAKKNNIQHLHAHFATYPAILAWIISTFTNIKFTVTAHAHDIYVNQDLLPIVYKYASLIFAISEFNKNFILSKLALKDSQKIVVLHCGIDLKQFPFQNEIHETDTPIRILSIGRLTGIKGYSYLLDALHILKKRNIPFSCDIIGDGPLENQLKNHALQLNIEQNVHFLGSKKTEEIPNFFHLSDIFVLACAKDKKEGHDGIPIVFMEAMAYGTPVIGTRISGIPELIRDNETGLCAKPMDAQSLAKNIIHLSKYPSERSRMQIAARKLIEKEFDILHIARKQRNYFKKIIE